MGQKIIDTYQSGFRRVCDGLAWRRIQLHVRLWLEADVVRVTPESPLFPRKQTSSAQERFGLKKRTFNVRFAPESRHKGVGLRMSAYDP